MNQKKNFGAFTLLFISLLFCTVTPGFARDITLQWDANSETDLAGYNVYFKTGYSGTGILGNYNATGADEGDSPINMPLAQDENSDPDVVEFTLHGLSSDQTYYFVVTAFNTDDLESTASNEVSAASTSPDTTPPVISNVQVSSTTHNSTVITWTTDEASTSLVQYGTSSVTWDSYPDGENDSSLVTSHSVSLTGLDGSTTYYFRVGSIDAEANGPTSSNEFSFTTDAAPDTTAPVISNVQVSSTTYSTAVITWTTDEQSDGMVKYSENGGAWGNYPSSQSAANPVTSHTVTLTGLIPETTYYLRVGSTDAAGNGPDLNSNGTNPSGEVSFTTDVAPAGMITSVFGDVPGADYTGTCQDTLINTNSTNYSTDPSLRTYTWPVDTAANRTIIKWDLSAIPQSATIQSATLSLYMYGYEGSGGDANYEISAHKILNHDPTISACTWNTYDGANAWTGGANGGAQDVADPESTLIVDKTVGYRNWNITQMVQGWINESSTNFGLMINPDSSAASDSNRYFRSSEYTDSNQRPKLTVIYTFNDSDSTAPQITSPPSVTAISNSAATIEWTTDEASTSAVQYGSSSSTWGNYPSSQNNASLVTNHSVSLTGLSGSTTYYFMVGSTDVSGNGPTTSAQTSFTTDPTPDTTAPVISNVQVSSTTHNSTVIIWTTDEASTSLIRYGTSSSTWSNYPSSETNTSLSTSHSITLTGLSSSTTYYFMVGSTDGSGNGPASSSQTSFTTNANPDAVPPTVVSSPAIDRSNNTIDVTYSESNMQNATIESNYAFSPSMLFKTLGESDDVAYLGNKAYRLSMRSIPSFTICTLTLHNIKDEAGNALTPNTVIINDDDGDDMADDWESAYGVSDPNGDTDSDDLNNLEEFNLGTNPAGSDTDGDGLPDGWEVTYGLDPGNGNGVNGGNGDIDNDGWTNLEEFTNGFDPSSDESPGARPPKAKKTVPRENQGNGKGKRVPTDTSFAVLIDATDGIDATDPTSVTFTVDDGVNTPYVRDLSDTDVVRLVDLASDVDTGLTQVWAVYDRSRDTYGNYGHGANLNIKVNAKDKKGHEMVQASYSFEIESVEEYDNAQNNLPPTTTNEDLPTKGLTTVSLDTGYLPGIEIVYDNNEPIKPSFGPIEEVPTLNLYGVTPVGIPLNLQPPTVFDNPVTLVLPAPEGVDIRDLNFYLYDGIDWAYACSSFNTGAVIQSGGEGWMVPDSMVYNDSTDPPTLEIQVHHFSAVQGGFSSVASGTSEIATVIETGGGCFIDTMASGSLVSSHLKFLGKVVDINVLIFTLLLSIILGIYTLIRSKNREKT